MAAMPILGETADNISIANENIWNDYDSDDTRTPDESSEEEVDDYVTSDPEHEDNID